METNQINELARKYRPINFSQYVGTETVNSIQRRFSKEETISHGILIYGKHGCGKTSLARLIAKQLLCINKDNEGNACGKCIMCKQIENSCIKEGEDIPGVQLVDIATDSGKAALETVLQEAKYPPMPPLKYKVLILDEVHMASAAAQNCILKILEEPPKHLIFILCTTNPEGLLDTLKSRCTMSIPIYPPTVSETLQILLNISNNEKYNISEQALSLIVQYNNCIVRDCINMLEDIALSNNKQVTLEIVNQRLNQISPETYLHFFSIKEQDLSSIVLYISELRNKHLDVHKFLDGLTGFILDAIKMKADINLDKYSETYVESVCKIFKTYTDSELIYLLELIEETVLNAKTINSINLLETILLNLCIKINNLHTFELDLKQEKKKVDHENDLAYKQYLNNTQEVEKKKVTAQTKASINDTTLSQIFGENYKNVASDVIIQNKENSADVQKQEILKKINAILN